MLKFGLLIFCLVWRNEPYRSMRISTNSAQITADTLPDPLVSRDRIKVENALTWRSKRRAELLHLFEKFVYGRGPQRPNHEWFELIRSDFQAMNGKVTLKEIAIHILVAMRDRRCDWSFWYRIKVRNLQRS